MPRKGYTFEQVISFLREVERLTFLAGDPQGYRLGSRFACSQRQCVWHPVQPRINITASRFIGGGCLQG
jgi:hypothetical protein